ncbi:MAG: hypothetical protein IPQ17_05650 [Xanthomonadales bacterium]|nr:hypothetical protein [Xanthomonadales bacterium]
MASKRWPISLLEVISRIGRAMCSGWSRTSWDQLEAVHIGQLLVDNQGIGAEIGQGGECRLPIAGKAHGHAALGQPARTLAGADRIHFGEQDAPRRLRGMHEQVIKTGNHAQ